MKKRNTKQKEIILKTIKSDKSHPTIKEIYEKVKLIDPSIGQATIYRNINKMVDDGIVLKLKVNTNTYRYDGNTNTHHHFLCKQCNNIIDIFDEEEILIKDLENKYSININKCYIYLEGICDKCK